MPREPKVLSAGNLGPTMGLDSEVQAVPPGGWTCLVVFRLFGTKSAMLLEIANRGEKPLGRLMLTRSPSAGAKHNVPWITDGEFADPKLDATPDIHTLGPGQAGQVYLQVRGVAEVAVWAQSEGTKAQVVATAA